MKQLLFIIACLIGCSAMAQTNALPSGIEYTLYKNANSSFQLIMPPGTNMTTRIIEVWNNGVKLSDSTSSTISGDTLKFTLTKAQIAPLTKKSYFFVRFSSDTTIAPFIGGQLTVDIGISKPLTVNKTVYLPNNTIARVSVIPDASSILQAINTVTAQSNLAREYRDSTAALMSASGAYISSRLKKGSLTAFRANTETIDAFALIDRLRSGDFYADVLDSSTPDDTVMTIVSGGIRYKRRVQEYVNPLWWGAVGDSLTDDAQALRKAAAYATAKKKTLLIEAGYVFTINSSVNFGCNIDGYGTIKTRSGASLNGNLSNITVKNITITGKHNNVIEGKGLYFSFLANVTVDNVKAYSILSQGIYFNGVPYARVINSRTRETRGEYGDGIYFGNCLNPSAINNICMDFQRIGIVFEQGCTNWLADGNITKNFFPSFITQINNGIWAERSKGGTLVNNLVENAGAKGLTVSPNTLSTAGKTYTFTVANNTVIQCGEGFNFAFSEDQILNFDANTFIDVAKPMEIGPCLEANISNTTFALRDSAASFSSELIRFVPVVTSGKKTKLTLSNCKNYVNSSTVMPINITNITGHKADLNVINCTIGNWGYTLQAITLEGDINYTNSYADFSPLGSTQRYFTNNINAKFTNSTIKLSKTNNLLLQGAKVEFTGCEISSDSINHIQLGNFGTANLWIERNKISRVKLYNIRKNTSVFNIIGNDWQDYPAEGIFNTAAVSLANLIVKGNNFSSVNTTNAPIQLSNGSTASSFGVNGYTSTTLTTGFVPRYEMAVSLSNASTTAPSKSSLNTTYGLQKAGTVVAYPSITAGAKSYRKISDSNTSDWEERTLTLLP